MSGTLTRSRSDKVLGGVCGGIAAYTGWDAGVVRLVSALAVIFTGVGLVAYIAAWILLPQEGSSTTGLDTIIGSIKRPNPNGDGPTDLR